MSNYDPDDFLMGGGTPSFKFDKIGASVTGKVVRREVRQQTDYKTGKPLFFEDGSARKQLIVTVETPLRDPEVENDDGRRNIYCKSQMVQAVREAVKAAGASGVEVGGVLTVTFVDQEAPANKREDGKKIYDASYVSAANAVLMGTPASQPPAAAPVAPPAAPTTPAAPPAAVPDAQAAAAAALAALSPEQRKALGLG